MAAVRAEGFTPAAITEALEAQLEKTNAELEEKRHQRDLRRRRENREGATLAMPRSVSPRHTEPEDDEPEQVKRERRKANAQARREKQEKQEREELEDKQAIDQSEAMAKAIQSLIRAVATMRADIKHQGANADTQFLAIKDRDQASSRQQNRFSCALTAASVFAGAVISELANLIIPPMLHH